MSSIANQITALTCCWYMHRRNFKPATVLNCGVGRTSPELDVWKYLLPNVRRLGIDPRWSPRGHWVKACKEQQVVAALGDGTINALTYCGDCRSLKCIKPREHTQHLSPVQVRTLDEIVAEYHCQPPYFIWMDIDGSEFEALNGATETLKQTGFINIEFDARYGDQHINNVHFVLRRRGFRFIHKHAMGHDRLYMRPSLIDSLGKST